jgi:hypothetical protein
MLFSTIFADVHSPTHRIPLHSFPRAHNMPSFTLLDNKHDPNRHNDMTKAWNSVKEIGNENPRTPNAYRFNKFRLIFKVKNKETTSTDFIWPPLFLAASARCNDVSGKSDESNSYKLG